MARYELSISPDYVQDWTIVEAFRELFQNGLDQETEDAPFGFEWIKKTAIFTSPGAFLDKSTLLFGGGDKANDDDKLGNFGEGYKLALLVLTRLGYPVRIFNRQRDEVWVPKIIDSRRYGSKLLVIDVEHRPFRGADEDRNLVIKVQNVTDHDRESIEEANLYFHEPEVMKTDRGDVLLNERYKGKIYVGGLFVTDIKDMDKGYNFKPGVISLDRDRNMASTFDICWATSLLWDRAQSQMPVLKMMHAGAPDTQYVHSAGYNREIKDAVFNDFKAKNPNGYPVTEQWEADTIKDKFSSATPIIVDRQIKQIVLAHKEFKEPELRLKQTPKDMLWEFFMGLELSDADEYLAEQLIKKSKEWR